MELLSYSPLRTHVPIRPTPAALALAVLFVTLGGCQAPHAPTATPPPQSGSAELVMYIANEPFVTAEPAYRAVYSLATGEAFAGDFGQLTDKLRADGLVGKDWNHAADQCLDRATVAFMVCRACKIQSGVNWMLTGLGRYAWRELQFKGISEGGNEAALMGGGEFVGLLSRAGQYLERTGTASEQQVQLGKPERPR
jgi:hypothetical protein